MSLVTLLRYSRRQAAAAPPEPTFTTAFSRRALMQFAFPLSPILPIPDGDIANAADRLMLSQRGYAREA